MQDIQFIYNLSVSTAEFICEFLGFTVVSVTVGFGNSTAEDNTFGETANDPVMEGSDVTFHEFAMLDAGLKIASDEHICDLSTNNDDPSESEEAP